MGGDKSLGENTVLAGLDDNNLEELLKKDLAVAVLVEGIEVIGELLFVVLCVGLELLDEGLGEVSDLILVEELVVINFDGVEKLLGDFLELFGPCCPPVAVLLSSCSVSPFSAEKTV